MQSADRVLIMEPSWDASLEEQAIGRAARITQTRSVHVTRLVTRGTIESNIYNGRTQPTNSSLLDDLLG